MSAAHSTHRRRPLRAANTPLTALLHDERLISQRKLAIAMYGYSWLKPAGCAKTMLGRREEEVEKEEVERQLREVEMQERLAIEAEEHERLQRLNETGEPEAARDLDDDIPDAEAADDDGGEMVGDVDLDDDIPDGDGEDDDAMEGDLDDEIPSASGQDVSEPESPQHGDANWVYDTRREPDTPSEPDADHPFTRSQHHQQSGIYVAGVRVPIPGSEYADDTGYDAEGMNAEDAEALANAMLDEDEMLDSSALMQERDLDEDVEEAGSGGWEHTDTEDDLDDNDDDGDEDEDADEDEDEDAMDISVLPPQSTRSSSILPPPTTTTTAASSARRAAPRMHTTPDDTPPQPAFALAHPRHPHLPPARTTRANPYATLRATPQSSAGPVTRHARMVSGNRLRHPPRIVSTPMGMDMTPELQSEEGSDVEPHPDPDLDPDPFDSHPGMRVGPGAGTDVFGTTTNATTTTTITPDAGIAPRGVRAWFDGTAGETRGMGTARRNLFGRVTRRLGANTTTNPAGGAAGGTGAGLFTPEGAAPVDATTIGAGLGMGMVGVRDQRRADERVGTAAIETPVNQEGRQRRRSSGRGTRFGGGRVGM